MKKEMKKSGLLQFQDKLTTNFQKTSLTWEIDNYSYKKSPHKNSGLKILKKSERVAILENLIIQTNLSVVTFVLSIVRYYF